MRHIYSMLLISSLAILGSGCAAEGMQRLSIQEALADKSANANLDPNIRLSFGDQHHSGREWTAIRRTNGVNKSTKEACNRAFLSAVIALQNRAKKEGKHSVVDIYSYHKKKKFSSSTQFECEDGSVMSAVTLRGRVQ